MAPPEKLRRSRDVEAACRGGTPSPLHIVEFSREKKRRWKAGLLLASLLAATAIVFAVIGLVTGLGVMVRSGGDYSRGCSTEDAHVAEDTANNVNTVSESQHVPITRCPVHPVPTPLTSPPPEKISSAIASVESHLSSLLDDKKMPGLVASITYRDRELWTKGFGVIKKESDGGDGGGTQIPGNDTVYRIASVSKIFVVLAVYQMYERGLIHSLDAPLNSFCPTFTIHNPFTPPPSPSPSSSSSESITLRQIMTSMSGLPREAPCGQPADPEVNLCPLNTSEILERLSHQSTILPPWTKPSYSNLGFALLARCLASHFFPDLGYEEYVRRNILVPLEMTKTGFNTSCDSEWATGYQADGSEEPLYDVGWWGPAGQMHSSTSDLGKLARFLYSTGDDDTTVYSKILSSSSRRLLSLPTYTNRDLLTGVGTPWEVAYQKDYTLLMKGGNLRGYSTVFSIVPDLKLGLNILFSGAVNKLTVAQQAYSSLIPAFVETLTAPTLYPLPPNITHYTGIYGARWSTGKVALANVHFNRGSLALSGTAFRGIYLAYRGPSRFQVEFADDELSCQSSELLGLRHSWVYFSDPLDISSPTSSSSSSSSYSHWRAENFSMPGFQPSLLFKRL